MNTPKKAANAVGGKTARACESCLRKRARWYCAADDAFLCHGCDTSVHSANQLASRHERVRLELKPSSNPINCSPPAWHLGFTRKARTPRHAKPMRPPKGEEEENITNSLPLVPEMGGEDASIWPDDENEEQLLYRVPIFNPFDGELSNEDERAQKTTMGDEFDVLLSDELENLHGFFSSDLDLEDFAADVESLLGTGLDEDSCGIEGLGLLDCKEEEDGMDMGSEEGRRVKVEDEDVEAVTDCQLETIIDWNFDCESPVAGEEEKVVAEMETAAVNGGCKKEVKSKIVLRLDYEAVISAWASQGCPWTTGVRPEFNPDDYWPDFMGGCRRGYSHPCGGVRGDDGGREARVSRYREKKRTRLFSKKIRYQVRKLNAEKRPRMKGRFVKRSSFALSGPAFPLPHQ